MINRVCISLFMLVLCAILLACGNKPNYVEFKDITQEEWQSTDTILFTLPPLYRQDASTSILIRHSEQYSFQNIWLKTGVEANQLERIEIQLASVSGHWLGTKSGSLYTTEYELALPFSTSDTTQFYVVQNMRENPLLGVQSIGLKME